MTKRLREGRDRNRDNNNYNKTNRDKLTRMYVMLKCIGDHISTYTLVIIYAQV